MKASPHDMRDMRNS